MDEKDKDGPKTGCGSQVAPIHTEQKLTFDEQLLCHLAFVTFLPGRSLLFPFHWWLNLGRKRIPVGSAVPKWRS